MKVEIVTTTDTGAAREPEKLWEFPEWMEPYRELIDGHGGNEIEELVNRPNKQPNLAFTNMLVFVMACETYAQVRLLERLHAAGRLTPTFVPSNPDTHPMSCRCMYCDPDYA